MQPQSDSKVKINRQIIKLAVPAILSNITVPLLGLTDTYISGHLGAEVYIAAIAAGTMLVNSLYWLFGFLRMGTTGLTAEAFGHQDDEMRSKVFTTSILLAFTIGAVLMACNMPLAKLLLWIMSPSAETSALAEEYFRISILAAPAFLGTMVVIGWMIGSQNTLYPMIISISVNLINITLSFSFVYGIGIGFIGVALGTCIANWVGLLLALLLAHRLNGEHRLWAPLHTLRKGMDLKRFFKVNTNLMLRSACIMMVLFSMTTFAGRMGDAVLARNAILMQFFMFFSYFMDGFAYGGEALCGRFAGAGSRKDIMKSVRAICLWSVAMTVVFTAVYALFLTPITAMLTDEQQVVNAVSRLRWVALLIPVISAAAFVFDGFYIGLTATWRLLLTTLSAMAAFFIIMIPYLGNFKSALPPDQLLWIAFLTFLLLRGAILAIMMPSTVNKQLKLAA